MKKFLIYLFLCIFILTACKDPSNNINNSPNDNTDPIVFYEPTKKLTEEEAIANIGKKKQYL